MADVWIGLLKVKNQTSVIHGIEQKTLLINSIFIQYNITVLILNKIFSGICQTLIHLQVRGLYVIQIPLVKIK